MLDDPIREIPGAFQGFSPTVSVPGLLHLEDARSLLRYRTYFRTQTVRSADLLKAAFSLRYQVYCLERKFEKPEHHPDKLETDRYDAQSVHGVLFYRPWDKVVGTTRLILPNDGPLPIHSVLAKPELISTARFPGAKIAEVSRFAVSRSFRPDKDEHSKLPCLGLVQLLLRLSLSHNITHWAAIMQPALLRMLTMMGIEFTPIGSLVSHHGLRQPCGCDLAQMLETLSRKNPTHWQIVTDGGNLLHRQALRD